MQNLNVFFKNHFNTKEISDDNVRKFTEINLQRMITNNPGGIYASLITDTTAAYNGYFGAITDEDTITAIKEGSTVAMSNAVAAFKSAASQKEGIVRGTYGVNSPTYQEFYPHGITEYTTATLENVATLMERMVNAATAHVADLGALFLALFTGLRDDFASARTAQLALIGEVSGRKDVTVSTRDIVEIQLMKNVLFIAFNNVGNLEAVNTYFDQSFLRGATEKTFSGNVAASSTVNIDERTYAPDAVIVLRNPGSTKLLYCIAPSAGDSCAAGIQLIPGEEKTVQASSLGDVTANHFLNVTNPDPFDGEYSVTVEI